jgi:dTDP-4-amino-4,6-dideoxygalactose transaminase
LPETDAVAASCLSLPMFPTMTDRQLRQVTEALVNSLDVIPRV